MLLKNLPEEAPVSAGCGDGSKGARAYDWQTVSLNPPAAEGWERCLLVRRSKTKAEEFRAYVCFAPKGAPLEKLIQTAGIRWTAERCFAERKSEVGLDQYEVRSYNGWYKHITFACLALALLTVLSCNSLDKMTFSEHDPSQGSLEAFKRGRGLRG